MAGIEVASGELMHEAQTPKASSAVSCYVDTERQAILIAACTAHRACCGTEHDPLNGKLHGYCVVCGTEWPCETAKKFI